MKIMIEICSINQSKITADFTFLYKYLILIPKLLKNNFSQVQVNQVKHSSYIYIVVYMYVSDSIKRQGMCM